VITETDSVPFPVFRDSFRTIDFLAGGRLCSAVAVMTTILVYLAVLLFTPRDL